MRTRPGCRINPGGPNALHNAPRARSAFRSQASAALRPAALSGTLDVSPFGGVTIRHRQSSVMTETHCPVMSISAALARAAGVGARSLREDDGAGGDDRERGQRRDTRWSSRRSGSGRDRSPRRTARRSIRPLCVEEAVVIERRLRLLHLIERTALLR